jgi:hypothetical protein
VSAAVDSAKVPARLTKLQDRAAMLMLMRLPAAAGRFAWRTDGKDRWYRARLLVLDGENAARLEVLDERTAESVCTSVLTDWFVVDQARWSIDYIGEDEFDRYEARVGTSRGDRA